MPKTAVASEKEVKQPQNVAEISEKEPEQPPSTTVTSEKKVQDSPKVLKAYECFCNQLIASIHHHLL